MEYRDTWDLKTIPEDVWASEHGRRNRAKQTHLPKPPKLKLCEGCRKVMLNATQRRKPCPGCGYVHPRMPAKP